MNTTAIMAHMIPYFPDRELSYAAAHGLIASNVDYLEVQFPFSDPSADGPTIEDACGRALASGFSTARGFEFVHTLVDRGAPPVFIMTYAGIVYASGVKEFCDLAKQSGAAGLIIPDLPYDYDEGLYEAGVAQGLAVVPVIAPSTTPARLAEVLKCRPEYVYAALRVGITGAATDLGQDNLDFLDRVGAGGAKVMAGFGIRSRDQVKMLSEHVHAVVVGSAFVKAISAAAAAAGPDEPAAAAEAVYNAVEALVSALRPE